MNRLLSIAPKSQLSVAPRDTLFRHQPSLRKDIVAGGDTASWAESFAACWYNWRATA